MLADLGRSRLSNNLNQLAKAANLGALPLTQEVEAELSAACAAIRYMRHALLVALGIERQEAPPTLAEQFRAAAGGQ